MFFASFVNVAASIVLAATVQAAPMPDVEAAEHMEPCRSCAVSFDEAELFDGYCPDCLGRYQDGPWCDCCGELLCGSTAYIVCDCHGIHGYVCAECEEWHGDFE